VFSWNFVNYFVVLYWKRDQKSFKHFSFSASLKIIVSGELELADVQAIAVQTCLFKEVFIGHLKDNNSECWKQAFQESHSALVFCISRVFVGFM